MTEHKEDKAFEGYLNGRSPLSDSYARLKDVGPSTELDRRILAEARREVSQRGKKTARGWRPWPALATIAVAGIAVIVSLDLLRTQSLEVRQATDGPIDRLEILEDGAAPGRSADVAAAERDIGFASLKSVAREETAEQAPVPKATPAESPLQDPGPDRLVKSSGQGADEARVTARAVTPATLAEGKDQENAGVPADQDVAIAEALAIARERVRERRREAYAGAMESVPEADRSARIQAQPVASAPISQRPATTVLNKDPELWLEVIDVLIEQGLEDFAAVQARLFRDTFPERPLEARHEALLTD